MNENMKCKEISEIESKLYKLIDDMDRVIPTWFVNTTTYPYDIWKKYLKELMQIVFKLQDLCPIPDPRDP